MGDFQLLEHTADMGIMATGGSLAELFVAAARGLREIVFGDQTVEQGREEFSVEVQGGDTEELLVNWLNELLFLMLDRSVFPTKFTMEEIEERHLRGKISGRSADLDIEPVREVKAVTFHLLRIEEHKGRWQGRVYVDL
jgi:SHS2 domain-containing protein